MLIDFDLSTILIEFLIFIFVSIYMKVKKKKENIYFIFLFIMFVYILNVTKLTIFPIYVNCPFPNNLNQSMNFIPFKNIFCKESILNVIMTIPFGFGIPFISKKYTFKSISIIGLFFGICIEGIQYIEALIAKGFTMRYIDINDVIFNFLGTIIGFGLLKLISKFYLKLNQSKLNIFWNYIYDTCININPKIKFSNRYISQK